MRNEKIKAKQLVLIVAFQMLLFLGALGVWRKPHLWCWSGAETYINNELCATKELKFQSLKAAKARAEATGDQYIFSERKEMLKNLEKKCLNWREEFDKDFKVG